MGGFVGAELAISFPTRVERLVLVSAAMFWQNRRRAQPLVAARAAVGRASWPRALVRATDDIATRPRLRSRGARSRPASAIPQHISDELAHELVRSARRTDGFLPALRGAAGYDLEEELPKIEMPDADRVGRARPCSCRSRTPSGCEELIPDRAREVFERTGHVAMLERPERFNRLLREFLAERGAPEAAAAWRRLARDSAL